MSDYYAQNDPNLKYYVRFTYMGDSNGNTIHRDDHPTMDSNWYWLSDGQGDRDTFLLMPAQQDSSNTIWYYVFTLSNSNHCWEYGDDKHHLLRQSEFTGKDNQKFCFEDAGNGAINIFNKGSARYLYRSSDEYESHHPIRMSSDDDHTGDAYKFKLSFVKSETAYPSIYMPSVQGAKVTDPNLLYNVKLLGPVPVPPAYNEVPPPPAKQLIGETLIPFFNVSSDPDATGDDLQEWQVRNRPYYRFRREQQMQVGQAYNLEPPMDQQTTWTVQCGMTESETTTFEQKTSVQVGFTKDKTAGIEFEGISATTSKGFSLQWSRELTTTVSDTIETTGTWTKSDDFGLDAETKTTYVVWQACDIWTLFYDDYKNRKNNDANPDVWVVPSDWTFASKFPPDK